MIATTAQAVNPVVNIRIIGDNAIVPSASGPHCYRVNIEDGVSVSCDCAAFTKRHGKACKHMIATDAALRSTAKTGLDTARAELVPQTYGKTTKPARKPAPALASLYSAKPAPTWTDGQKRALAAHFAEFEAAVW